MIYTLLIKVRLCEVQDKVTSWLDLCTSRIAPNVRIIHWKIINSPNVLTQEPNNLRKCSILSLNLVLGIKDKGKYCIDNQVFLLIFLLLG